ncbi:MAG: GH92 family glycosyl hydrolase [Lentimicrobiaceae bacterium]|jgi:predicted alpha-1,2-mannosidase
MKKTTLFLLMSGVFSCVTHAQKSPADYVNTFIGTGGHGHTYPGATMPFGMVQLSPDTRLEGWDGCGGYHYDDQYIYGFSHTHLNGTGVPDLCDILFMPTTGETRWNNGSDGKPGYGSHFKHGSESSEPGYYKVVLDDYNITAELTATTRAGMHCYTFPASKESNILVDLFHRDEVLESSIKVISDTQIEGLRRSHSWSQNQYVYFVAEFSKPFSSYEIAVDNQTQPGIKSAEDKKNIKAIFHFKTTKGEKIYVKVGISAVNETGAGLNLNTEIPDWDFSKVRNDAKAAWNKELSKIEVEGGTDQQKTIFYTALYHTMVNPNTYMDVDGFYRGRDLKVHKDKSFTNYTVFSLWDTYRAFHPLMTIIDQKRTLDYIKTFLTQYDQGGLLPVWELDANETFCMIGYHSVPVIVDAYLKGINGFDTKKAFAAMRKSATREGNIGLKALDQNGYISSEDESESVSKTLEYAYDDWCIAQFAKSIGKHDEYKYFIKRGQNYKNLFDASTGFMRARSNGGWFSPFDPFEVNFNYTEANSWQYSFSTVQDMTGFIQLLGGKENLAKKLDQLFSASSKTSGRDQSDITGLIGQYAHGNEPSHHIAYLYPFASQPWKTQKLIHQILTTLYHTDPDGLAGNEDCGQMSAWAVMSAMGFYQVTPGTGEYVIGTPWFSKVTINLENGKKFVIRAKAVSASNIYIQSATLNGKNYDASFLKHSDIMDGGELTFTMSNKPNKKWGVGPGKEPATSITDYLIVPAPAILDATKSFKDKKVITITGPTGVSIFYSLTYPDGKISTQPYLAPFTIEQTSNLRFYAQQNGSVSPVVTAGFVKMADDKDIELVYPPANQYSSGGANNLIDGIRCSPDFRVGGWLGFEKVNLEAIIDLRESKFLTTFGAGFLQEINAWVFMPSQVEFFISDNATEYKSAGIIKNDIPQSKEGVILKTFEMNIAPVKARFVKVIATNIGNCPPGHKGQGASAWMFADEIIIK